MAKKKKNPRYMNLMTDYAFKLMYGSEKNKPRLIQFLNAVLKGKEEVVDVTFHDKEALPYVEDGKRMVFDIYCTTNTGSHIIVEMQRVLHPTFTERALAYCMHGLLKQMRKGGEYKYERIYGIFVMDFHLADMRPRPVRSITLMDEETHEVFSDKLNMVFLDLATMKRKSLRSCRDEKEEMMFLIKNLENMKDKVEGYPQYDDLFDAADIGYLTNEEVVTYSQSRMKLEEEREGLKYYGEQQLKKGIEKGMKEGIEKGLKEGIEKGIEKGKKEGFLEGIKLMVRKLKSNGFNVQQIASYLNTPISEIELLLE